MLWRSWGLLLNIGNVWDLIVRDCFLYRKEALFSIISPHPLCFIQFVLWWKIFIVNATSQQKFVVLRNYEFCVCVVNWKMFVFCVFIYDCSIWNAGHLHYLSFQKSVYKMIQDGNCVNMFLLMITNFYIYQTLIFCCWQVWCCTKFDLY